MSTLMGLLPNYLFTPRLPSPDRSKFTKLGLPLWCSHCQESPVLKVEGSRGSCREMYQMFNPFVRNRMIWLEDIRGATVFDYVLQCLMHDFLP
jgi:hypothetical protein